MVISPSLGSQFAGSHYIIHSVDRYSDQRATTASSVPAVIQSQTKIAPLNLAVDSSQGKGLDLKQDVSYLLPMEAKKEHIFWCSRIFHNFSHF